MLQGKIENLKVILAQVRAADRIVARRLASLVGQIISMGLALGTIARLRTRGMYSLMNSKNLWNKRLHVSDEVREELEF